MEGWATIRYLYAQGQGIRAIAKELGVARRTVRHALRTERPPKYERAKRPNPKLEPFSPTIRELYYQKQLIGSRILREIRAKGYTGGSTALYAYLRTMRVLPSGKVTERFEPRAHSPRARPQSRGGRSRHASWSVVRSLSSGPFRTALGHYPTAFRAPVSVVDFSRSPLVARGRVGPWGQD
jgi:hypothetical protein